MAESDKPSPMTPAAGWYPDPENSKMERYWDGSQWTADHRPPFVVKKDVSGWLLLVGYAGAIFFPLIGLVVGVILLVRKATGHGVAVLAVSITVIALGVLITINDDGGSKNSAGRSAEEIAADAERAADRLVRCIDNHPGHAGQCKLHLGR